MILTDKQMDKLGGLFIKLMTYYLSDKNYPMDNPIQTYNPSLVWKQRMTVFLTGLSRVFVREYFKDTSGCWRTLNEQRPQEAILRKNQGTSSHYKTRTVNTPLPYSIWWSGTSKKSGLIQEMKRRISPPPLTHAPRLQTSSWSLLRMRM